LSRPPFFGPAEVKAAMMRGNAEVVLHWAPGGILKVSDAQAWTAGALIVN
jgi:hypothetical protein